ncbi:hypothetical protein M422DRAFT_194547, partial [Sphaerobolus stellatus SS14]
MLRPDLSIDHETLKTIKTKLANEMKEMRTHLSKMESLRQELEKAEKERSDLQERIDLHQSLLAPVRRLIPDLLTTIFEFCIDDEKPSFRRDHAPLVLAHVCHSWRQLAIQCPSLWSNIRFGKNPTTDALSMWIANSSTRPLDLHFTIQSNSPLDLHFTIASSRVGLV